MLTPTEQQLLRDIDHLIDGILDKISLQGNYPVHNVCPAEGTGFTQYGTAVINTGVRSPVVQYAIPRGYVARWYDVGPSGTQTFNYDTYLMIGSREVSPWNPIPASVQPVLASQFAACDRRRIVPIWVAGPTTLGVEILNNGANDTFCCQITGWITPRNSVPQEEISFYRGGS